MRLHPSVGAHEQTDFFDRTVNTLLASVAKWWNNSPPGLQRRGFPLGRDIEQRAERLRVSQRRAWPWLMLASVLGLVLVGLLQNTGHMTAVGALWLFSILPWLAQEVRVRWLQADLPSVVLLGFVLAVQAAAAVFMLSLAVRYWIG